MGKRSLILFLIITTTIGHTATSNKDVVDSKGRVMEVGAKLNTLEKQIGSKNAHYLLKLEEANNIEKQMLEAEQINENLTAKYKSEEKKYWHTLENIEVEDEFPALVQEVPFSTPQKPRQNK